MSLYINISGDTKHMNGKVTMIQLIVNAFVEKENEQKRLAKEAKRQARKEMLRRNWSLIATGSATFAGFIVYTIKKIKK